MAQLSVSKFVPEGMTQGRTMIFYNDQSVPKNAVAFLYLHFRIHNRIAFKCKLKKEAERRKEVLRAGDRQRILGELDKIAKRYNYRWEDLLKDAERPGGINFI